MSHATVSKAMASKVLDTEVTILVARERFCMYCCLQTYKMEFYQTISHIEKEKEERLLDESRWTDSWSNSIQKIRSLY